MLDNHLRKLNPITFALAYGGPSRVMETSCFYEYVTQSEKLRITNSDVVTSDIYFKIDDNNYRLYASTALDSRV